MLSFHFDCYLPSFTQSREKEALLGTQTIVTNILQSRIEKRGFYRIFWLIVVALSWYGSSLLIAAQYDAFQNNPISFVVETTYKDWDTEFPSVVVCENDNSNRVEEISDR